MGTLLFWQVISPYTLHPYAANNERGNILKIEPIVKNKTKEPEISIRPILKDYSREALKRYLTTLDSTYGLDDSMLQYTVENESSFNPEAVSPGGKSIGTGQFTLPTWLENCSNKDERRDPYKSLDCMVKLWARGEQYRWDAYCLHWFDQSCVKMRNLWPGKI